MELSFLNSTLLLLFLPFLLYFFFFSHGDPKKKSTIYGLKPYPILGYLPHYVKNWHRFLDWSTEILARSPTHTMGFRTFGRNGAVITANPKNVEHILKTNFDNYPRGELTISTLVDFFGHGIFNSVGEQWLWQRKAASFEFSNRSLRNFVMDTVQTEIANRLLPLLNKIEETNQTVDFQNLLERFAIDNICNVAFGEDPACLTENGFVGEKSKFMKDFGDAQKIAMERFMNPLRLWRIKKFFNIGCEKQMRELISTVHGYTMKIVQARKQSALTDQKHDLLSRFSSRDNSDESLRDVVTNFILAGRETTSSALTWFFWLVSTQPNVEKKIVEEIKSVRCKNQISSDTFDYDDLREMNYLHAAITESMRLYPPVAVDSTSCKEDDFLPDGTFAGKGWFISYSAYAMGRIEDIWGNDCNEFIPERWLQNGIFKPENSFKCPVFHAGPRMCLGKEMAYIQMKSVAACVFERFRVTVVGKEGTPETLLSFTLRMKGGLPIQVLKRENYLVCCFSSLLISYLGYAFLIYSLC